MTDNKITQMNITYNNEKCEKHLIVIFQPFFTIHSRSSRINSFNELTLKLYHMCLAIKALLEIGYHKFLALQI